jgi:hypothetical protein
VFLLFGVFTFWCFYFLVFLLFGVFHFSVFFGRVDKGATIKAKAAFSEYFKFSLNFGMACEQQVVYEKRDFVKKKRRFSFCCEILWPRVSFTYILVTKYRSLKLLQEFLLQFDATFNLLN